MVNYKAALLMAPLFMTFFGVKQTHPVGVRQPHARPCSELINTLLKRKAAQSPSHKEEEAARVEPTRLNDIHSQLNKTKVLTIHTPTTIAEIQGIVRLASKTGRSISISGGRHAMGGQQFGKDTIHISMEKFNRIGRFDKKNGFIEVESGVQWPELIHYLLKSQEDAKMQWGITQKQTGADRLSIGGAISANIHGRGLTLPPFINDLESLQIIDAQGDLKTCSRSENPEFFRLVVGGYGLFGVITSATIRLSPRTKLKRIVKVATIDEIPELFAQSIKEGCTYGDFQYSTNEASLDYLKKGIFAIYVPVDAKTPIAPDQKEITEDRWKQLYELAHFNKATAYCMYMTYYLSTSGQIYWSDTHQLSTYFDNYHDAIDSHDPSQGKGSEMITEVYVPLEMLPQFMDKVRAGFLKDKTNVIYGTIRLIKQDTESFLAWAKQDYACIIFNLHVRHTDDDIAKAKKSFRKIINKALSFGGSYYLTYHRWAKKGQVLRAYPQFIDFLNLKMRYDPESLFESNWYRHYRSMFDEELNTH